MNAVPLLAQLNPERREQRQRRRDLVLRRRVLVDGVGQDIEPVKEPNRTNGVPLATFQVAAAKRLTSTTRKFSCLHED